MKKKTMLENAREYVRFRRNLGYIYKHQATRLESFGEFVDSIGKGQPLTVKLALQWATDTTSQKTHAADRLCTIRTFARYLIVNDPRTELIPANLLRAGNRRANPYIYSRREITSLMNVDVFPEDQSFSQRTFSTIIGLLAASGIRIGESLSLRQKNIDWKRGTIVVKNSKRLPTRLVPIHASVLDELKRYEKNRNALFQPNEKDVFFLSHLGKAMHYQKFLRHWHLCLDQTNIGGERKKAPRIYDIRHTFACNHLLRAYKQNNDIDVAIHLLSVYLGHSTIKETYWYLTAVPDLQRLCSKRFENHVLSTNHHNNENENTKID